MSGDGDCRRRKQDDDLQSTDRDIEIEDTQPPQRPMTALPDSQGAVGREGSGYTYLSELERQIGGEGSMLLEMFLFDQVERGPFEPNQRNLVQTAVCPDIQQHEDHLSEIALRIRFLGDELNGDVILNRLVGAVSIQSSKEDFMKVCHKVFDDGQCNWGRVVALFCFVYQLIKKAVLSKIDSTVDIPWIKEIFSWAMECFYQYAVKWIIQRGGWRMIREYFGPTQRTLFVLGVAALCTVLYVCWKQE